MNRLSDPLQLALRFMGRFHSIPVNLSGSIHGLPLVEGRLTPELFVRAAKRSGFESKIVGKSIRDINDAVLPIILLLKDDLATVLLNRTEDDQFEFLTLMEPEQKIILSKAQLKEHYTGFAIMVKPVQTFESRSQFEAKTVGKNWFWGTLWRFRGFYSRVAIATIMINSLALASSIFVMNVYDRVVPNQATDTLIVMAVGVLCAYSFEFILKSLRTFFVDRAGHRIDLILGSELFARVLGMRYASRPASAGTLAGQARSYESLREFFASATIAALVDLPFVFVFAGVVYMLGGVTALPLVIGAIVAIFIGALMQIPISQAVSSSYQAGNQRQALFVEGINSLETIKATRCESEMQARLEECVHTSAKAEGKSRSYSQLALNLTAFIQHLVSTAIIVVAYFQVKQEAMTMGAMIACVIISGRAMAPLGMVASLLTRLQQSRRSLKGLNEIMEAPLEREERGGQYIGLDRFEPRIIANQVSFSYNPEADSILKGVSFSIQPGERVALLGRIGSGKSSLLRMLMSLYEPSDGNITISGIDIRQLDPAELRRRIGYLPQDPMPLFGTLRSNLTAGCPWIGEDAIWTAIQRVGLAPFVQSLPRGLDSPVAEAGRSLSGGQRQALALARAIIEEPELLIFDEPTSAIDQSTERHLLKELNTYLTEDPDRTLIIATHKRSILQLVDRVIVLENGQIVADGPKETVLAPKGSRDRTGPPPATDETIALKAHDSP